MTSRFLLPSPIHHELQILLAIERGGPIALPLDPRVLPTPAPEEWPLARLIGDGFLQVRTRGEEGEEQVLGLTPAGTGHMRRLAIDYHLELMSLRESTDAFFRDRVAALTRAGWRRVCLYGASDTARVLVGFLASSSVTVAAILDDDPVKQGQTLAGVPVVAPDTVGSFGVDAIVVTTVAFEDEILRRRVGDGAGPRLIGLFQPE